jgi:hypothetical protein
MADAVNFINHKPGYFVVYIELVHNCDKLFCLYHLLWGKINQLQVLIKSTQ